MLFVNQKTQKEAMKGVRPDTVYIFRAKKVKPGYYPLEKGGKKARIDGSYHACFNIKPLQEFSRTVCGKMVYVDWATPFKIIDYNELCNSIDTIDLQDNRKRMTQDISAHMCMRCLSLLYNSFSML